MQQGSSDDAVPPGSFFSFLDTATTTAVAPAPDDFVATHIQPHTTITQNQQNQQPRVPLLPPSVPFTRPNTSALNDQIHPLIRSRKLDSPEDIAAWIAERKSRYPTAANIRKKALEQQEQQPVKRKRTETSPLTSMLAAYADSDSDSSSSSGGSAPEVAPAKHYVTQTPLRPSVMAPDADRRALRVCRFFARGNCAKGASCPFAHPESIGPRHKDTSNERSAANSRPAASLLQMLLAKDVERENRRLLQCIEHIHKHEFFNIPLEPTAQHTEFYR
ncbi:hypothetical protein FB645_004166 [Coemansia sp. IMI 203386]|nr:hypothetical protein FB645_004166 [Coemansia sp. IMI 203386]